MDCDLMQNSHDSNQFPVEEEKQVQEQHRHSTKAFCVLSMATSYCDTKYQLTQYYTIQNSNQSDQLEKFRNLLTTRCPEKLHKAKVNEDSFEIKEAQLVHDQRANE